MRAFFKEFGIVLERECTNGGPVELLDDANGTFDFGDVFVSGAYVHAYAGKGVEGVDERGEFIVTMHGGNGKTAGDIGIEDRGAFCG